MDEQVAEILLTEFRAFRQEFSEFKQQSFERITTLEAHDKDLYGNGRPGRVAEIEEQVDELQHIQWKQNGILIAIWSLITMAVSLASHWFPWGNS